MNRWTWRAPLFLLLGLVLNTAVAWACVLYYTFDDIVDRWQISEDQPWSHEVPTGWPPLARRHLSSRLATIDYDRFTARRPDPLSSGPGPSESRFFHLDVIHSGWPLRTYRYHLLDDFIISRNSQGNVQTAHVTDGHPPPSLWADGVPLPPSLAQSPRDQWKRLPIAPVWTGLAANTALYGAAAAACWTAPGLIRAALRARCGQCRSCGYPVSDSPRCTECGKPVKPRTAAAA